MKISIFDENVDFSLKFRYFTKISIIDENFCFFDKNFGFFDKNFDFCENFNNMLTEPCVVAYYTGVSS